MLRISGFVIAVIMVLGIALGGSAYADTNTTTNTATAPVNNTATAPTETEIKCASDEFLSTENGQKVCKKVPTCNSKDEVISFDTANQKFACKKILKCDPKKQQAVFLNGKNVCIDIPNCEAQGMHYAFDGNKMICK